MVTRDSDGDPIAATLLRLVRGGATSPAKLCVSLRADAASVTRGRSAEWNVSVWSENGTIDGVSLKLATSLSSQKPQFIRNGTSPYSVGTATSSKKTFQAQVHIAATATSVRSVNLTVTGVGTNVKPDPTASAPIGVTAPKGTGAASPSASGTTGAGDAGHPAPGSGVLTPAGVRSTLSVGALPFVNASGARAGIQPELSPGGNASSLFPTLSPSAHSRQGDVTSRIRPVADPPPGDESLMGAQYAGLVALALAFILSVTRLSVRRQLSSSPG